MKPEARTSFAARCAELCPGFVAGAPLRARKSDLLAGTLLDGVAVVAKRVARPDDPVWTWYFAREVAIYRAVAPPVRVPRVHAIADDVIILERIPEPPLATRRRPAAALPPSTIAALLDACAALAAWQPPPVQSPSSAVTRELRRRTLEDPSAPLAWIRDGLGRVRDRGAISAGAATRACGALAAHAAIAPCHGDLLLRNVHAGPVLLDWECAGDHAADWDRALLWTQLAPAGRAQVEAAVADPPARAAAFRALALFALAREVLFLDAFRAPAAHPARAELARELAELEALLRRSG
jgi:hypothetical protein